MRRVKVPMRLHIVVVEVRRDASPLHAIRHDLIGVRAIGMTAAHALMLLIWLQGLLFVPVLILHGSQHGVL